MTQTPLQTVLEPVRAVELPPPDSPGYVSGPAARVTFHAACAAVWLLLLLHLPLALPIAATPAARNGEEGLALARREGPDLVLTDAAMPVCDGYELIRVLRVYKRTRGIPVVMISARVESASKNKAFTAGAVSFLKKPFEFDELLNRIRELLA